jgi:hypothetical protein
MITAMETTTHRFRKGRGILVSAPGRHILDNVSVGSELVVDEKLAIFGPSIENDRWDGRWMNTITQGVFTGEVLPW